MIPLPVTAESLFFFAALAAAAVRCANAKRGYVDANDADVAACNDYICNAIGDADRMRRIAEIAGRDPRDVATPELLTYLADEAELARMGHRRN